MKEDVIEEPVIRVSWLRDLFPIVMLLISGLVWGMKLEGRYDKLEDKLSDAHQHIASLQSTIDKGILPLASEKLSAHENRLDKLEKDCLDAGMRQ
jgi:hypothetical protein